MPAKLKNKQIQPKAPEYPEASVPEEENDRGAIRISSAAIATIIRYAACSVEGVTRITGNSLVDNIAEFVGRKKVMDRSIQTMIQKSSVSVELSINICYGVSLPEIAAQVQKAVASQIEELTGLQVKEVNVIIREMEDLSESETEEEQP